MFPGLSGVYNTFKNTVAGGADLIGAHQLASNIRDPTRAFYDNGPAPAVAPRPVAPTTAAAPSPDPYAYQRDQLAQGQKILDALKAGAAPKPLVYSKFDIAGNSAKARSAAEGAVNPLYQKKLQDFLDQQRTLQARQQEDAATANQQVQDALTNTLQANDITKGRVQDQSTNYQADTGQAFNDARLALLRGGQDVGVGQGGQAAAAQVKQANTQEGRQMQTYQQTFEDLGRSSEQAKTGAGNQKKAVDLSLARYIQDNGVGAGNDTASIIANSGSNIKNEANTLEGQRLNDILNQTGQYEKTGYQQFLSTLTGQNLANTAGVYNGLF